MFDYLFQQIDNYNTDNTLYPCPICKCENSINTVECKKCGYALTDTESIMFSKFNKFNQALDFANQSKFIEAFELIVQFLEYYPTDKDALRLKILLMQKLNADTAKDLNNYCKIYKNDRWVVQFEDGENLTFENFDLKPVYQGKEIDNLIGYIKGIVTSGKIKGVRENVDLINSMYALLSELRGAKKQQPFYERFKALYENEFLPYLTRKEVNVFDPYGKNYKELLDTNSIRQEEIGKVLTMEDKKLKDGYIIRVLQPCITYHSVIIQKMDILIINNEGK